MLTGNTPWHGVRPLLLNRRAEHAHTSVALAPADEQQRAAGGCIFDAPVEDTPERLCHTIRRSACNWQI
jgi:hypothetical protein